MASHRTDTQLWLTRVPRAVVAQISRRLRSDSPLTELDRAVYANAILRVALTRSTDALVVTHRSEVLIMGDDR